MRRALLALSCVLAIPAVAHAKTGFGDAGQDIEGHDDWHFDFGGYLRLRGESLYNLDLDRGPTTSGEALFPVPLDDPDGQSLFEADMRLRTDLAVYAPGGFVALKLRADILDNFALGSTPEGIPSATTTQRALDTAIRIRRAYGEILTPIGLLAAGRMGQQWGLGMVANGGDCPDCDSGDVADRIAFITPIAGHIWAVAFDITSSGPLAPRASGFRPVDVTPTDDVRSVTFAMMHWLTDEARQRRLRASRTEFEYGAYAAYRWQDGDIPASYLPTSQPIELTGAQVVPRGFRAFLGDVWLRLAGPGFHIEAEGAIGWAEIAQPSLVPGVLLRDSVSSLQWGVALQSEFLDASGDFTFGLDAGAASGDSAPGFGAFPGAGDRAPRPGDLDGPQANVPSDTTVDNFRFHPDYRIDRILFHEIIGTVTDAFYARPHARVTLLRGGPGELRAAAAAIASFAVEPTSTPGNARPLGVELDPTLLYESRDGFQIAFEYALLVPLAGLDGSAQSAAVAQLARLRLGYLF